MIQESTRTETVHPYLNRQISWMDFNDRVLAQTLEPRHPLLERVRFLSISETNLDEFFMIRVAGLQRQLASERSQAGPDGMTPIEQLAQIRARTQAFFAEQRRILNEELLPELRRQGIELVRCTALSGEERATLRTRFQREVLPILTPLAIDNAHPFPHISNLSLNLLVVIAGNGHPMMARVKVPTNLPRFIVVSAAEGSTPSARPTIRLLLLEDLIATNLDELFPGKHVDSYYQFQVTRDADLVIQEDEAADLLAAVEGELGQRQFGEAVRLVVSHDMPEPLREWLMHNLEVKPSAVYAVEEPLALGSLAELTRLDRPDLLYPPITPRIPASITRSTSILNAISEGDLLLYHPYDSFTPVVDFVRTATVDPSVLAIKQTLYRVGTNSPVVEALLEARDEDTQVAVLVELKARFDEEPNIGWARQLEANGVHVIYGMIGLKTHAKACLLVRREGNELKRYVHLGTGNYNAVTARVYTDFSFFTDDPVLCEDVADLFNYLTGYSEHSDYRKLLVAPINMRGRLLELIEEQRARAIGGQPARIVCKVNSLTDEEMMDALFAASQAGVEIDLIVRGICSLRPGVEGVSERIRVVSLIGRFLEHARVYAFGVGDNVKLFMGSADLMSRNLDDRVETVFPIEDVQLRDRVLRILELQLSDNVNAWELQPDGTYLRVRPAPDERIVDSQEILLRDPLTPPTVGATGRSL